MPASNIVCYLSFLFDEKGSSLAKIRSMGLLLRWETRFLQWCRTEKVPNGNGQFFEYPDEGHAFMNEGEDVKKLMKTGDLPTDIDSGTRDLAWSRVFEFLDRTLL